MLPPRALEVARMDPHLICFANRPPPCRGRYGVCGALEHKPDQVVMLAATGEASIAGSAVLHW